MATNAAKYQQMSTDELRAEHEYLSRMVAANEQVARDATLNNLFERAPDTGSTYWVELTAVETELAKRG